MKKLLAGIVAGTIALSSFVCFADEVEMVTAAQEDVLIAPAPDVVADSDVEYVDVYLDGQKIEFDVQAQIINDRTMVPMRKIFESFGAKVSWLESDQAIIATKGSVIMMMVIGSKLLLVTDIATGVENKIELDVPPMLVGDRTLVPLRAISESLGLKVEWDEEAYTVYLTK